MKKLTLDNNNCKIAGVCGGLGRYFEIDPVIFRIGFLLFAFGGGSGIFVYFIMWLSMQEDAQTKIDKKRP
jgi:phage shock protein C